MPVNVPVGTRDQCLLHESAFLANFNFRLNTPHVWKLLSCMAKKRLWDPGGHQGSNGITLVLVPAEDRRGLARFRYMKKQKQAATQP